MYKICFTFTLFFIDTCYDSSRYFQDAPPCSQVRCKASMMNPLEHSPRKLKRTKKEVLSDARDFLHEFYTTKKYDALLYLYSVHVRYCTVLQFEYKLHIGINMTTTISIHMLEFFFKFEKWIMILAHLIHLSEHEIHF